MPVEKKSRPGFRNAADQQFNDELDQFLYNESDISDALVSSNKKNRLTAKKKLDQLITADTINFSVHQLGSKKATPVLPNSKSRHVVDLNRAERIKARGFDKLTKPDNKNWFKFGKIQLPSLRSTQTVKPAKINLGSIDVAGIRSKARKISYLEPKMELERQPESKNEQPANNPKLLPVATFAIILLALILPVKTIWLANNLSGVKNDVLALGNLAVEDLKSGAESAGQSDYQSAKLKFEDAAKNLTSIELKIDNYNQSFITIVENIPKLGTQVKVANQIIEIGQNLSQAAAIISAAIDGSQDVNLTLQQLGEKIDNVEKALEKINKDAALINLSLVPEEVRPTIQNLQTDLPNLLQQLSLTSNVIELSNKILGNERLSRVLIVFQNNRELRATGGFMGSYALADFTKGKLTGFNLPGGGSYDTEAGLRKILVPPYGLQLIADRWQFWDSNWWPDFPTSAQKMAALYQESQGQTVDYVLAINSDVMVDLLKIIGPVYLPDYDVVINDQNFYDIIQQEVQVDYDKELNQPKKILSDAAPLIIEKLLQSPDKLLLSQALLNGLSDKSIQIYAQDNQAQKLIENLSWDGSLLQTDKDYLNVVSSNIAGGKSDAYITESIDHRAEIAANGEIIVTTKITKTNSAPKSDVLGYMNNVDFLRIYVPQGSVLVSAGGFQAPASELFDKVAETAEVDADLQKISGDMTIDDSSGTRINNELNKVVFSNWMQVEPGQTSSVYFKYRLPFRVNLSSDTGSQFINYWSPNFNEVDSYSLLIDRQSGKKNSVYNSTVVLDPKFKVVWSNALDNTAISVNDRLISVSGNLDKTVFYSFLVANK